MADDVRRDFELFEGPEKRIGWLLNMLPTTIDVGGEGGHFEMSALELFLLGQDSGQFRVSIAYEPYFYVATALRHERLTSEVCGTLTSRFSQIEGMRADVVEMVDLDVPNHAAGRKRKYVKLSFRTVKDLLAARRELQPAVKRNRKREDAWAAYGGDEGDEDDVLSLDLVDALVEIREYDVPYYMRAAIDLDIRVGAWHEVSSSANEDQHKTKLTTTRFAATWRQDIIQKPEPRILAFDIECTKAALKFPNAEHDEVFMISYMIDGQGFLIVSRTVVSEDVADFEYTPKPQFPGPFTVFNEIDEHALLQRFVTHCRSLKPHIYVTYNGDFFDWPFLKRRGKEYGIDFANALGIAGNSEQQQPPPQWKSSLSDRNKLEGDGEYRGTAGPIHLDAFYWVKRDSYLPQGSQGLKAVTKCKLGYDPVEVDPEDMVRFAAEDPSTMAAYSVSDAVATFYLYDVYVNLFIFSLCTVIPNAAEDVLRKGSGTLCESLLMVQAHKANVVAPNKQSEPPLARHNGHVVESETYVGGHVECLETGVFRSDLDYDFDVDPGAIQELMDKVERDVKFAVEVEGKAKLEDCINYQEVCDKITSQLAALRDEPKRAERPFIYHLDVGAMYPNIILTNRLQPTAIASREICASCDYNVESNKCKRPMDWVWRGELNPAASSEVAQLRRQLSYEIVDGQPFHELDEHEQAKRLKKRLKDYSQKVYKKTRTVKEEHRTDVVCMRENSFYIDTVRAFRDRRYDYKSFVKKWRKLRIKAEQAGNAADRKEAEDKELLFDSLQLAHKCILNSFYGYVMRKGARWRSMPMAGIVTLTGANLITQARELVERIGRPLELDTDGIWCMLPSSFPENFDVLIKTGDGDATRKLPLSYPCAMLNADVHANYTNHQYQTLKAENGEAEEGAPVGASSEFEVSSECSIFFEVDGPYRCMVIPASTEEGKLLKKRYAVFNHDGSLAELKGFELKRRGELELIKSFQSEIFEQFLRGDTLEGCYASVAEIANQWLDFIEARGGGVDDDEILDLISENRAMSREVSEYEGRKMTSLTTARRLADFLGEDMLSDKGLQCKLVISAKPAGAPITDRAVPTAIFATEPAVKRHFLRKWLKDRSIQGNVREVIDWDYYRERLDGVIRKIVTIPAALQKVPNPVPRVKHPDWLRRLVAVREDGHRQTKIDAHFRRCSTSKSLSATKQHRHLLGDEGDDDGGYFDASDKKRRGSLLSTDVEDCAGGGALLSPSRRTSWIGHASSVPTLGRVTMSARKRTSGAEAMTPKKGVAALDNGDEEQRKELSLPQETRRGPPPQIREGFEAWLADRKARWRSRRATPSADAAATSRNHSTFGAGSRHNVEADKQQKVASRKRGASGVVDLLRRADMSLNRGTWRVLEVRQTEIPGELHAWVVTDLGHLHRVSINVPRIMYVEISQDNAASVAAVVAAGGRKAQHWRTLRAANSSTELYELRLPERRFSSRERPLATFLAQPGVEAAYELSTPLWFRALLSVGSGARVASTATRETATKQDEFVLDDLELASHDALGPDSFRVAFLYHSSCPRTGRGIVAVFFINKNTDAGTQRHATATVVVIDPYAPRNDRPPPVRRLYEMITRPEGAESFKTLMDDEYDEEDFEAAPAKNQGEDTAVLREWAQDFKLIKSDVVRDQTSAFSAAAAALADYAAERRGTTIVVVQSSVPASLLRRSVPALAEFPNVEVQAHAADSTYPSLGWRNFAARRALERLTECPPWLEERFNTATFANLPVANLGDDSLVRVADVAFARLLRRNRHLLWASEGSKPDLGGADDIDGDAESTFDSVFNQSSEASSASKLNAQRFDVVDAPGVYRCACVEIDVFGLAVNAVMVSDRLDDDAMDVEFASGGTTDAVAGGACEDAFRFLKALVADWINDVAEHASAQADMLLVGFYRWISARSSLLYFPALRHVVIELMRRVHARLVTELRRLGMRVVHASFHKLILATPKMSIAEGKEHLNFVARTLAARPIFRYLALSPKAFYASLLFLDRRNFTGIEEIRDDENESNPAPPEDRLVSNWALANKLPELAREYFPVLVGSFVHKPLQFARDNHFHHSVRGDDSEAALAMAENAGAFIDGYLTEKSLAIVSEMQRAPSVHVGAAPLEFVTLLSHIIALDKTVEMNVIKLRRLLLATLGVREFSPQAHLKPEALAVVVPDAVCSFCNACSDLDLTDITARSRRGLLSSKKRDGEDEDAADAQEQEDVVVLCDKCQHPFDLLDLELRVVEIVEQLSMHVLQQDSRCNKCARVATGSLAILCPCSGKYGLVDAPPSKFHDYVGACTDVAKNLKMEILEETCRGHLAA